MGDQESNPTLPSGMKNWLNRTFSLTFIEQIAKFTYFPIACTRLGWEKFPPSHYVVCFKRWLVKVYGEVAPLYFRCCNNIATHND